MVMHKNPHIRTARQVELFTQSRREEEQRVSNLLRYNNECQRLEIAAKAENQSHHGKANTKALAEMAKKEEEERRKDIARAELLRKKEQEEEEARKQEELLQKEILERDIQRICESSEELKELEKTLKIAYVNKERAAQQQEAMLLKHIESTRERFFEEEMEQNRKNLVQLEEDKIQKRREALLSQKHVLQSQMKENEVSI